MKAVVTGMIATFPLGGVAWDYGQYLLGLERLGLDVYYLEDTGGQTYDPRVRLYGPDPEYGVSFLDRTLTDLSPSLADRWHFRSMDGQTFGMSPQDIEAVVADAAVFINVSGGTLLRDAYMKARCKILIDTDPGWNHFRVYPRNDSMPDLPGQHRYRAHDRFFTYAGLIGTKRCLLPSLGIDWHPTRPPVVTSLWEAEQPGSTWTTVLTWANYKHYGGPITYAGLTFGSKELEFEKFEQIPQCVPAAFEIAVGGLDPPRSRWERLGWSVRDSHGMSASADDYRHYIQRSRGEFSVAKNVYVATQSGWFSCRTVCYLAAGLPAVIQDTGYSASVPTGEGLLSFSTLSDAVRAVETVERNYAGHQQAARALAQRYFASDIVLADLLSRAGL